MPIPPGVFEECAAFGEGLIRPIAWIRSSYAAQCAHRQHVGWIAPGIF